MTIYLELVRAYDQGKVDLIEAMPNMDIPNFDFGEINELPNAASFNEMTIACIDNHAVKTPVIGRAFVATNCGQKQVFIIVSVNDEGLQVCASFIYNPHHDRWVEVDAWTNRTQTDNGSVPYATFVAVLLQLVLDSREITYVDDTGPDITTLNAARAKRGKILMPVPKIIRLNDVRYPSARGSHAGDGHKLSHMVEVASQTRHYRNPIKHGPNAGKTVIQVRPHIRGAGLPPRPKTAEYMQHRVVA